MRHSSEKFNFRNGSVGNFFFAGARIFFRSLEAAIFLFSRVARLPEGSQVPQRRAKTIELPSATQPHPARMHGLLLPCGSRQGD